MGISYHIVLKLSVVSVTFAEILPLLEGFVALPFTVVPSLIGVPLDLPSKHHFYLLLDIKNNVLSRVCIKS
jgi:hypothetical protein